MIDIKLIRQETALVEKKLQSKVSDVSLQPIVEMDAKNRALLTEIETLKSKKNALAKTIG